MTNEPIVGIRNMIDQPRSKTKGPNHTGGRLEKNTWMSVWKLMAITQITVPISPSSRRTPAGMFE
jgi:hypothetical protein